MSSSATVPDAAMESSPGISCWEKEKVPASLSERDLIRSYLPSAGASTAQMLLLISLFLSNPSQCLFNKQLRPFQQVTVNNTDIACGFIVIRNILTFQNSTALRTGGVHHDRALRFLW